MRFLSKLFDERFLAHRQRSTSAAGIAGCYVAILLFAWRFYVNHLLSWDLLAVCVTVAGVKMALMTWYRITD